MHELLDVFENYLDTKRLTEGLATKIAGAKDQQRLLHDLPLLFRQFLGKRAEDFTVKGSIGSGNMPRVPWVGVFRTAITDSAENGYYIVLLFSEDMQSCYLSLNQGFTAFTEQYAPKLATLKISETAQRAIANLTLRPREIPGQIVLATKGRLGKGYQQGAIVSYRYEANALPTQDQFRQDFEHLLQHYDTLFQLVGKSLQTLSPVTESQYQQSVLEQLGETQEVAEPVGGVDIPNKTNNQKQANPYPRNPKYAVKALKAANFQCELDPSHHTFLSSAKGKPYIEAHHLIPMAEQSHFEKSLDVSANIIALCPTCHRFLHHGRNADKKPALKHLLAQRQERLKLMALEIDLGALVKCYSRDLLGEEE
ncbi:DUF3578 domain-containing protein [Paludibacterium sp. THUN1379]|uniref:MrcB family domain-containing protein n=1 Tax=Paludibacterium sp. THUN1379 TaxID=3112107 RepID=UPI00308CA886|nr:DUF3578 domain-containing protein [Paludibacterium sp. THUN1379]